MESDGQLASSSTGNAKALTSRLVLSSMLASLGALNFGYNLSVVNTTAKTFRTCLATDSTWSCFPVDKLEWGFVAGILCLGALIGSLVAGPLTNRLGRRATILWNNVPYLTGFLILMFSQDLPMLLVGRFLVGMGVGGTCLVVPLYLTEMATVAARGLIGSTHQMFIVVGIMLAEVVGSFGLYKPFYWRIMFGLGIIPCIVQLIGMLFWTKESPRYLCMNQRYEEGRSALKFLRGPKYYSELEFNEITGSERNNGKINQGEQKVVKTWSMIDLLFRKLGQSYRSLIIAAALHIAQQFSGVNSILLFSDSIFTPSTPTESTGSNQTSYIPLLITFLNFIMTMSAIAVIDRFGRRFLALSSSGIATLGALAITIAFVFKLRLLSIISVLVFVGAFGFGLGPVPWLVTSEIFPTEAVGAAVTFAVSLNWICNMLVTVTFPSLADWLKDYAILPYGIFLGLFFIFSLFFLPETKGRQVAFI